jgi:hypothetical protein
MGIWQFIFLAITFVDLGCALANHGKPRYEDHNFWTTLMADGLAVAIVYAGGFFG